MTPQTVRSLLLPKSAKKKTGETQFTFGFKRLTLVWILKSTIKTL
jgi:hypothetical protein